MRKVLITGGLGFIGRHMISYFKENFPNYQLTIIDDLSGSEISPESLRNIEMEADVRHVSFLDFDPGSEKYDDLFHLASPVGAIGILDKSGKIAKQIVDLADQAAQVALKTGARLMYISSSEIYYASPFQDEECEIRLNVHHGARIEYAIAKYTGEIMIRNMGLSHQLNYNICRPFNLIGEGQSPKLGFVVPRFFEACFTGQPLEVFGNGHQVRSFCDVKDFLKYLIDFQGSDLRGEILNIGNLYNKTTILDLAGTIKKITGSFSEIRLIDPEVKYGRLYMEGGQKIANTEKAEKLIGLKMSPNLNSTLERIFNYYKISAPAGIS